MGIAFGNPSEYLLLLKLVVQNGDLFILVIFKLGAIQGIPNSNDTRLG